MIFYIVIQKIAKTIQKYRKQSGTTIARTITIIENHNYKMRQNEVWESYLYQYLLVRSNSGFNEFTSYYKKK